MEEEVLDLLEGWRDGERRRRQTGTRAKAAQRFDLPHEGNAPVDRSLTTHMSVGYICRRRLSGLEAGRLSGQEEDCWGALHQKLKIVTQTEI